LAFSVFSPDSVREVTRAAYSFSKDLVTWAAGVHEALGPNLDTGLGTLVCIVEFPENKGVRIRHVAPRGGATRVHQAVLRLSAFLAADKLRESFFNGRVLGSSSGHYEDGDFTRMQARAARSGRTRDAAGWCVNDAVDHGFMVVSPSREILRLPEQPLPVVRRLGSHIATGLRLQRVLGSAAFEDPAVEAILDAEGRAQHSVGMARMSGALEQLRQSVLERARTKGPDVTDPAWSAVLAGRWSLVDRFDSDGRRYVVAYRNPPGVLDPRRLTPREEGVTALAAIGRSNKEIASQLGVTQSTVATLLASALTKLGLTSRTMLPLFWRDLHGRAWAVSNAEAPLIALSHQDDPKGMSGLTPAERAVALALLEGMSDRHIALARNSSRHTVSKHITAIYRKLGVSSRAELAYKLSLTHGALGESMSRAPQAAATAK
jgi:DNA-binding NarL/FixJ family response regulator